MQHPGRHGSGRTAAAACGDPTDFASLSVAYFAALEAASDAGAAALGSSRRLHAEEIDINLRLAVFGLSLGHYTVHVSLFHSLTLYLMTRSGPSTVRLEQP
jgi:hypothetical protein